MIHRLRCFLFLLAFASLGLSSCANRVLPTRESTSYYYGPSTEWQNYTGGYNAGDYNNAEAQLQGVLNTPPECINCQTNCDNSSDNKGIAPYRFTR